MLLLVLACTCIGAPPEPDVPATPTATPTTEPTAQPARPLPPSRQPLCATPLGCGLLIHYSVDTVTENLCGWCGADNPALCRDHWLPVAPGSDQPRCEIYRELERCILQHSGTTRFADLPDMAQANILNLQEREDAREDCVE